MSDHSAGSPAPQPPSAGYQFSPVPPSPGAGPPVDLGTPIATFEAQVNRGSSVTRLVVAVTTVVAMVGAGMVAAALLLRDSGPTTPEAAVERFLAAVNDEDVLGLLEALPRGEGEAFRPLAEDILAELQRLDIVDRSAKLGPIPGVELAINDYQLSVAPVGDGSKVANVTVSGGNVTAGFDLAALPMGDLLRELIFGGEVPRKAGSITEPLEDDIVLTTVKHGSTWHVSLFYSLAETIRREAGAPAPDFAAAVVPRGAESPEAAVAAFASAVADLDLERTISLLAPGEAAALHDYAPLFLADAEGVLGELRAEAGLDLRVALEGVNVSGGGDRRTVTVSGFSVDGTAEGETVSFRYAEGCATATFGGVTERVCANDPAAQLPESLSFVEDLLTRYNERMPGAVVVKHDGSWYLSPVGTAGEAMVAMLRALERHHLESFADLVDGLQASPLDLGLLGLGGLGGFGGFDGFGGFADPGFDLGEDFGPPFDADWPSTASSGGFARYLDECSGAEDAVWSARTEEDWRTAVAAAAACARPYLDSGDIDVDDLLTEVGFPKCYPRWPYDPSLGSKDYDTLYGSIDECVAAARRGR